MKPKTIDAIVLAYGIFLIAMGVLGYILAHHIVSLIAGGISGALVLGFLAITAKKRQIGRIGVAVVSLLMFLQFTGSIIGGMSANPPKPASWQALTIAPVSLAVFIVLGLGHMAAMKARKLE